MLWYISGESNGNSHGNRGGRQLRIAPAPAMAGGCPPRPARAKNEGRSAAVYPHHIAGYGAFHQVGPMIVRNNNPALDWSINTQATCDS